MNFNRFTLERSTAHPDNASMTKGPSILTFTDNKTYEKNSKKIVAVDCPRSRILSHRNLPKNQIS